MTDTTVPTLHRLYHFAGETMGVLHASHIQQATTEEILEPGMDNYIEGLVDAHKEFRRITHAHDTFAQMLSAAQQDLGSRSGDTAWTRGFSEAGEALTQLLETSARAESDAYGEAVRASR